MVTKNNLLKKIITPQKDLVQNYSFNWEEQMPSEKTINAFMSTFHISDFNFPHLTGTNYNYKKFIILGSMRTGSTLLANMLMTHSNAVCFHELFQKSPTFFYPGFPLPSDKNALEFRNTKPLDFLDTFVYKGYNANIKAVGFKLFYDQAVDKNQVEIWNYLKNLENFCIIHLIRKNIFETYVSLQLSLKTKIWAKVKPETYQTIHSNNLENLFLENSFDAKSVSATITINPDECRKFFIDTENNKTKATAHFKGVPIIELFYEDLILHQQEEALRILTFLNLEPQLLKTATVKQNTAALHETVSNYNEVKDYFSTSKWVHFFKD